MRRFEHLLILDSIHLCNAVLHCRAWHLWSGPRVRVELQRKLRAVGDDIEVSPPLSTDYRLSCGFLWLFLYEASSAFLITLSSHIIPGDMRKGTQRIILNESLHTNHHGYIGLQSAPQTKLTALRNHESHPFNVLGPHVPILQLCCCNIFLASKMRSLGCDRAQGVWRGHALGARKGDGG
jgi:hypothetical protein